MNFIFYHLVFQREDLVARIINIKSMLTEKKIGKKKLIIYIVIMAVMFGSTIFFISKNYSFTFKKTVPTSGPAGLDESPEPGLPGDNQAGEEKGNSEILNSPKFKSLKDNSIDQSVNPAP